VNLSLTENIALLHALAESEKMSAVLATKARLALERARLLNALLDQIEAHIDSVVAGPP